jgi:hypothetical protein
MLPQLCNTRFSFLSPPYLLTNLEVFVKKSSPPFPYELPFFVCLRMRVQQMIKFTLCTSTGTQDLVPGVPATLLAIVNYYRTGYRICSNIGTLWDRHNFFGSNWRRLSGYQLFLGGAYFNWNVLPHATIIALSLLSIDYASRLDVKLSCLLC